MITINFEKIENRRKEIGVTRAELARRVSKEEDTLMKFFRSGKQITNHLNLLDNICKELKLNLWGKGGIIG
jgi:transcriptional regulator with XRE-family HTH domain